MSKEQSFNKYVFLSYGIGGVGGGQNYLKNRCSLYKQQGLKVYLVYTLYDPQDARYIFDGIKRFSIIGQSIRKFSNRYIRFIINKILKLINYQEGDNIIIESDNMQMALWGEVLAMSCKGKNFYYILGENDVIVDSLDNDFFMFKLARKEIAGIHKDSVKKLFANFKSIANSEQYLVEAAAQSYIKECQVKELENLPTCDYTIGMLSRLDKPYVMPVLSDLIYFFSSYTDKKFNLVIVGDGHVSITKRIKQLYKNIDNVNVILTGSLDPLPSQYPQVCDVCIGTSGCAYMTHSYGRTTISIDGEDFKPIGILGITTENRLFRSEEPIIPIDELLEQILIHKKYPLLQEPKLNGSPREENHAKHHNYIMHSTMSREYFNMNYHCDCNLRVRGYVFIFKRIIESVIGTSIYYKLFTK